MADFEMPYFVDGGGNKGYFKDVTAREQISEIIDVAALTLYDKGSVSGNSTKVIDMGTDLGMYLLMVGQGGSWDLVGMYVIKITRYSGGTNVKTILTPVNYAPTVAASEISTENAKISITSSTAGFNYGLYRFNLTM